MAGDLRLGARIRKRLLEMNHDQRWLAQQLSRDQSTISRWINGSRRVTSEELRAIGLVLHRSPGWLLRAGPDGATEDDLVTTQKAISSS